MLLTKQFGRRVHRRDCLEMALETDAWMVSCLLVLGRCMPPADKLAMSLAVVNNRRRIWDLESKLGGGA